MLVHSLRPIHAAFAPPPPRPPEKPWPLSLVHWATTVFKFQSTNQISCQSSSQLVAAASDPCPLQSPFCVIPFPEYGWDCDECVAKSVGCHFCDEGPSVSLADSSVSSACRLGVHVAEVREDSLQPTAR